MNCIKCGREHGGYHFRVLQVQTLHVRDVTKEKRVQALGDFEEYDVCAACAKEKYDIIMDVGTAIKKAVTLWSIVMVLGLVIMVSFWNGDGVFRLAGLGLLVGGGLCLYSGLQNATQKKRELMDMPYEKALYQCAWECLIDEAPKKNDINDITYIPVDEETLAKKNGDLMLLYELLPEIAIEAHKRIHSLE